MKKILCIIASLLSLQLIAQDIPSFRKDCMDELQNNYKSKNYYSAEQTIHDLISVCTDDYHMAYLLYEKAFIYLNLKQGTQALKALDKSIELCTQLLKTEKQNNQELNNFNYQQNSPSQNFYANSLFEKMPFAKNLNTKVRDLRVCRIESIRKKALWMHFGIAAARKDKALLLEDIRDLKIVDKTFPFVSILQGTVSISSIHNIEKNNIESFTDLLKGFGYTSSNVTALFGGQLELHTKKTYSYRASPRLTLELVEIAAATVFGDSPWASAAWEYVGKTISPNGYWYTFGFGNDYKKLLDGVKQ